MSIARGAIPAGLRTSAVAFVAAAIVSIAPRSGHAQVIRGRVHEQASGAAVPGVAVVVRDSLNIVAGFTRTDERGMFSLRVPLHQVHLRATRVGFTPESASTIGGEPFDTLDLDLAMRALPRLLSPVVVAEERRQIRAMRVMGLDLRSISTDLITPAEIAASARGAGTYLNAIARYLPAGLTISSRSQCVAMNRGVRINAAPTCAMVIVDGMRLDDPARALDLVQPQWLDHAIFIRAADAGVRFGTGAGGGVLLLFTTYGSYALPRPQD